MIKKSCILYLSIIVCLGIFLPDNSIKAQAKSELTSVDSINFKIKIFKKKVEETKRILKSNINCSMDVKPIKSEEFHFIFNDDSFKSSSVSFEELVWIIKALRDNNYIKDLETFFRLDKNVYSIYKNNIICIPNHPESYGGCVSSGNVFILNLENELLIIPCNFNYTEKEKKYYSVGSILTCK